MRNTPIRRSTKRIPRESEKHRLKRLAEQSKPFRERPKSKRMKGMKAVAIRRSAIKPKKRSAKSAERIYGPKEFREWLHAQPCMICLASPEYTEQAHAKGDGMARKASWRFSFPACGPRPHKDHPGMAEGCHRRIHRVGVKTFEEAMGFTLLSLAEETQSRWRAHVGESA